MRRRGARWVRDGEGLQGAQAEYVRVPLAEATLAPVPAGVTDEQARPGRRSGRGTGAARCSPPHELCTSQHGCGLRPALQLCNYAPVGVRQSSDWQHQAASCDPALKACTRALFSDPTGPRRVQAVLCGDVLATGWFCAERGRIAEQAGAPGGAAVAVLGLGPVGLMAAVAARQLGAAQARPPPHLRGGISVAKDARVGRTLPRRSGQDSDHSRTRAPVRRKLSSGLLPGPAPAVHPGRSNAGVALSTSQRQDCTFLLRTCPPPTGVRRRLDPKARKALDATPARPAQAGPGQQVFAVDSVPERLDLARAFGATPLSLAGPAAARAPAGAGAARKCGAGAPPAAPGVSGGAGTPQPAVAAAAHGHEHSAAPAGKSRAEYSGHAGAASNGEHAGTAHPGQPGGCAAAASDGREPAGGAEARRAGGGPAGESAHEAPCAPPSGPARTAAGAAPGTGARSPARSQGAGGGGAPPPSGEERVLAAVRSATGGRGADAVLEAVGSQRAVALAYQLIRPGGAAPGRGGCLVRACRDRQLPRMHGAEQARGSPAGAFGPAVQLPALPGALFCPPTPMRA